MEKSYKYMVATQCFTYNQSAYIEDALNGFALQDTSFPVVYLIVDDASTDGEQDVLRRWANDKLASKSSGLLWEQMPYGMRLIATLKEKTQSYFVIVLLSENHYRRKSKKIYISEWLNESKYKALCEGDDYWIKSDKLQKQVDFMELHDDYSMCFHSTIEHWENGSKPDRLFSNIRYRDYLGVELFADWIVATSSVLIKSSVYDSELFRKVMSAKLQRGDTPVFCTAASLGKVKGMSDIMSVYRRNEGSFMFQKQTFDRLSHYVRDLRLFPVLFGDEYKKTALTHVGYTIVDTYIHSYLHKDVSFAKKMMSLREPGDGFYIIKSFVTFPFRSFYYKYLRGLFAHRK